MGCVGYHNHLWAARYQKRRRIAFQRRGTNLGVVGQHVVPQDGRPGIGHLADVGNHHDW